MKSFSHVIVFFVFISAFAPSQPVLARYKNLKQNLAIIDFENQTTVVDIGTSTQDILTTALWKTDRFILVEREKIQEILREQNFSYSGRVSTESAVRLGRILGADYILTGGITEAGYTKEGRFTTSRIALDIRLIDVATSQITLAETASGTGNDLTAAVRVAAENLVQKIARAVDKKPWQSSVIKVDGQTVYINAGINHGIQRNDHFVVYEQGEELRDPRTGATVGFLSSPRGEITITDVQPSYSVATVVAGKGFTIGDIVKQE